MQKDCGKGGYCGTGLCKGCVHGCDVHGCDVHGCDVHGCDVHGCPLPNLSDRKL